MSTISGEKPTTAVFEFMMGSGIEFYTARKRENGSLHRAAGTLSRFDNADIHETMLNMLLQNEAIT